MRRDQYVLLHPNHPHIETALVEQEVGGGKIPSCSDGTLSRALIESRVRGNRLVGPKSWDAVEQASEWVVQLRDENKLAARRAGGVVAAGIFRLNFVGRVF